MVIVVPPLAGTAAQHLLVRAARSLHFDHKAVTGESVSCCLALSVSPARMAAAPARCDRLTVLRVACDLLLHDVHNLRFTLLSLPDPCST